MHAGGGTGDHWNVRQPPLDGAAAPTRRCRSPRSTVPRPPLDGVGPHSLGADHQRGLLLELRVLMVPVVHDARSPGQPKTGPLVLDRRDAVVEPRPADLAPP